MTVKCKAEESLSCSCVDVGTIIDGSDCSVEVHQFYSTEADANAALERLTKKARNTESDPCEIKSEIVAVENGVQLNASFTFSCQAEAMIFELANR
ncbi:TPA: YfcZ/YiiS family protein [Haemophilus influenzae]